MPDAIVAVDAVTSKSPDEMVKRSELLKAIEERDSAKQASREKAERLATLEAAEAKCAEELRAAQESA